MAIPKVSPRVTNAQVRSDGNRARNSILLGLSADECNAVFERLEFVELPKNFVLQIAGPIKFAYFINSGLASVLDGENVEVGLAGKEGFIGAIACKRIQHESKARHHEIKGECLSYNRNRLCKTPGT